MNTTDPSHTPSDNDVHDTAVSYGMLRFITVVVIIFAVFMALYEYWLLDSQIFISYLEFCTSTASKLINLITSEETTVQRRAIGHMTQIISENKSYVLVTQGCDASTVFAVLICTVAAWPAQIIKKIFAIIVGLMIMFGLNIVRIAGMMMVEIHIPDQFDLYHEWILPSLLVLGPLIYFYCWTIVSGQHPDDIQR